MADTNYVKAYLETLDGSERFTFDLNPELISYDSSANFARLAVLNTDQPLTYYQSSSSGFSIPSVKFWSDNSDVDLTDRLQTLRAYTRVADATGEPPVLRFTFGSIVFERIHLVRFSHAERQWRNGSPTMAEGALEFLLAPTRPEPLKEPVVTELSEREQEEASALVDKLLTEQGLKDKYRLTAADVPKVDAQGNVTIKDRPLGTLPELLGDQTPEAWKNLGKSSDEIAAATPQGAVEDLEVN